MVKLTPLQEYILNEMKQGRHLWCLSVNEGEKTKEYNPRLDPDYTTDLPMLPIQSLLKKKLIEVASRTPVDNAVYEVRYKLAETQESTHG